jgi:hypothetical protein
VLVSSRAHGVMSGLLCEVVPDAQRVQVAVLERRQRVGRGLDNGLAVVERGVQDGGDAGDPEEFLQEGRQAGRGGGADGLHAGGPVDMYDGGDLAGLAGECWRGEEHERGGHVEVEPLAGVAGEDGGGEGPERLPVLDPRVQCAGGLGGARVREDAALAERAGAEFAAAWNQPISFPAAIIWAAVAAMSDSRRHV